MPLHGFELLGKLHRAHVAFADRFEELVLAGDHRAGLPAITEPDWMSSRPANPSGAMEPE
jgi:hypothetical protein